MADYTATTAKSETLTADTADLVTLTGAGASITVFNLSAGSPIYFRCGAVDATTEATVAGADCFVVPPNTRTKVEYPRTASGLNGCDISLISAGAQAYTVQTDATRLLPEAGITADDLDTELAALSSQFAPSIPTLKSRQVPAIDPAQAYVAIIFDDGHNTVYNTAYPLMRARGMVGTLAITTDLVGTTNYMTWAQIREMEADGWEIASHSKSHANLLTATDAEETDEIELSKAALLANGVQRVRGFVAPYGLYNADTLTKVKKHYEWQRFNGEDATYPQLWNIDRWNLTAYNPGSSLDRFKAKIDRSIYNGIWCSPLFHYIDRTGAGGNSYDTDDFIEFLDYIVSRRVAVGTYSDRLLASTAAQEYAEVAYNGNFADGSGGIPHGWTRSAGTCVWSLSGGDPLFPTIPVVDVPTSSDLMDGDPTYWAPVTAGDTYVLSQTMRADTTSSAGTAGYLFITWYQSNKSTVISNSQDFAITLPTAAYRSFSLEATAPALAAFCRIRLRSGTSTRCLVANVSFRKKRA